MPKRKHINFDSYIHGSEPKRKEKAHAWRTAIGLQEVDGLQTSVYLQDIARKHIEGDINIEEARKLIHSYYESKTSHAQESLDTEEADKVSANIAKILNEKSFSFSAAGFLSIHRRLFEGVFEFAGKIRDYDITKKEWVLGGATVLYVNYQDLLKAIEYDLQQENNFSYKGLSMDNIVNHIVGFVSNLWQIHPFKEGNTRTTAVFTIKYLRSIGFEVDNDLFANNSWYFRNALVRANYRNVSQEIEPDKRFLISFFRNLMMGEKTELINRSMLINAPANWNKMSHRPTSTRQVPDKYPTSFPALQSLIKILNGKQLSVKEMLFAMKLKDRENFMEKYLSPAMKAGYITMLYPESPKHPHQKYLLTEKGVLLYKEKKF
ncbi:MAG: Fic family protein [Bacteroidales bacterium]|jgi:fido (protein-threonine AMPylation protein)|nr:Fic family protein [Bacteroidales bacterium]